MKKLTNTNVQNAVEHAVCTELHRRDITAIVTPTNTQGTDIIVILENRSPIGIQVKASRGNTQPLCWLLDNKVVIEDKSFFYAFVNVWKNIEKAIEFFIVSSKEVKAKLLNCSWAKISLEKDAELYRSN